MSQTFFCVTHHQKIKNGRTTSVIIWNDIKITDWIKALGVLLGVPICSNQLNQII